MLNQLERRIGWIAFPSIIRYLALFQLGVLGLTFVNRGAGRLLEFNWTLICQGEFWRIFTFIFSPLGNLQGEAAIFSAVLAIFSALLLMTFSDGLEEKLGTFRTTLFFLTGWFVCSMTCVVMSATSSEILFTDASGNAKVVMDAFPPGLLFDIAILYAFATYYPRFEVRLMLFLPVPIALLALLSGIVMIWTASEYLNLTVYILSCLSHYLVILIPVVASSSKRKVKTVKKEIETKPKKTYFHVCEGCSKNDATHPKEVFRVTLDGKELCEECLKKSKKEEK